MGELTGGTVSIAGANILFTPATNFNGTARFIYTIQDNGKTDGTNDFKTAEGIVRFEVTAVNDRPIAEDQVLAVDEDGSVLIMLTGLDGDPVANQTLTFAITAGPGHGTVSGFSAATGQLTYRPAANYTGLDTIQFTVTDDASAGGPALTSLPGTVTINVGSAADVPSVTPATTHEGQMTASGLVITPHVNDVDVTHFKISRMVNGTLFLSDGSTPVSDGTFITRAQGGAGLRFLPTAGLYSPGASFQFEVQAALNTSGTNLSPQAVGTITVQPNLDFGDAPDPAYPTLLANDGARHVVLSTNSLPYLGQPPDTEDDGKPSSDATGDNNEDGVIWSGNLEAGRPYTLTVITSGFGLLNAWIDWNRDGNWNGAGEQVLTNVTTGDETNTFILSVPATFVSGQSFARFRISSEANLAPTGLAGDGEVEDYAVVLDYPPVADLNGAQPGGDVSVNFTEQTPVLIAGTGTVVDPDSPIQKMTVSLLARPDGDLVEWLYLNPVPAGLRHQLQQRDRGPGDQRGGQ